jgi:hypothetical protein
MSGEGRMVWKFKIFPDGSTHSLSEEGVDPALSSGEETGMRGSSGMRGGSSGMRGGKESHNNSLGHHDSHHSSRTGAGAKKGKHGSAGSDSGKGAKFQSNTAKGQKPELKNEEYRGQWLNNKPHGFGEHIWHTIDTSVNSELTLKYVDRHASQQQNNKYVGQWKNGERNGYGVFYYANGSNYKGKNGELDGYGVFYYVNGSNYKGEEGLYLNSRKLTNIVLLTRAYMTSYFRKHDFQTTLTGRGMTLLEGVSVLLGPYVQCTFKHLAVAPKVCSASKCLATPRSVPSTGIKTRT